MADNEAITLECQKGWKIFCRLAAICTAAVFAALGLMAYFLV